MKIHNPRLQSQIKKLDLLKISYKLTHYLIKDDYYSNQYNFFIGCCCAKVLRLFEFMNIECISSSSYFRHTRSYINPTVIQYWGVNRQEQINRLKEMDGGIVLAADER